MKKIILLSLFLMLIAYQANALAESKLLVNKKDKLCAFSKAVPVSEDYAPKDRAWRIANKVNGTKFDNINFRQVCEANVYVFIEEELEMTKGFSKNKIILAIIIGLLALLSYLLMGKKKIKKK